ncbi:MbnH family di-heme enzyme [Paracoccus sp. (in: a-proteobacteria)]|uniref:MbnH family di-heme enzyme n=1 Tax=Paracoccus sp. TaxID=267 RepID=UPI003A8A798E
MSMLRLTRPGRGMAVAAILAAAVALIIAGRWLLQSAAPRPHVWTLPEWMAPPPVPEDAPMTRELVDLGRHLFYDARLSADGTVACASCHQQSLAFSDGRETGIGIGGTVGHRNSPGLTNVGYQPLLTWANPHFTSLEFQALTPMFGTDPLEMGAAGQEDRIFAELAGDRYYKTAFRAAFPDRPAPDLFTVTRALGAFQRSLTAFDSAYDRATYGGDRGAMSDAARRGQALFFDHRLECYHCHPAPLFTDNLQTARMPFAETAWHNTGLYNLDGTGAYPPRGEGLAEFSGRPADMGRFRTPSLRNVALTAPYMHDGSIATLAEVIDHYAAGGREIVHGPHAGKGSGNPYRDPLIIGFTITPDQRADLIAFLESLTDEAILADPAFADPWPDGHPAVAQRMMPDP